MAACAWTWRDGEPIAVKTPIPSLPTRNTGTQVRVISSAYLSQLNNTCWGASENYPLREGFGVILTVESGFGGYIKTALKKPSIFALGLEPQSGEYGTLQWVLVRRS